nr:MAG TPA: hypothetical protein [Caudoviricetes sp.]
MILLVLMESLQVYYRILHHIHYVQYQIIHMDINVLHHLFYFHVSIKNLFCFPIFIAFYMQYRGRIIYILMSCKYYTSSIFILR